MSGGATQVSPSAAVGPGHCAGLDFAPIARGRHRLDSCRSQPLAIPEIVRERSTAAGAGRSRTTYPFGSTERNRRGEIE